LRAVTNREDFFDRRRYQSYCSPIHQEAGLVREIFGFAAAVNSVRIFDTRPMNQ